MALIYNPNVFFKRLITSTFHRRRCLTCSSSCARFSKRLFSNNRLSDSSIILQTGVDIQELPLVVRNLAGSDAGNILFCSNISDPRNPSRLETNEDACKIPRKEEIEEIIVGFNNCNSQQEVFKLLEILPSNFVEPAVAFQIIKKMSELNENRSVLSEGMGDDVAENFTTAAIFNQLIETILSNNDSGTLINFLKLLNQRSLFRQYFEPYREKLIEKIMLNVTKNVFTVPEICEIVEEFHISGETNDIDKLWIGIAENSKSIDSSNIINVFHVLPCFNASRNVILRLLLDRFADVWCHIESQDVIEILTIAKSSKIKSHDLMQMLGRWLNTKIHSVNEDDLSSIIRGFSDICFVNLQVISALERYVKMKGDAISNASLLATIMDYCDRFRIRSSIILEKASDFFISKGKTLPPDVIKSLVVPYGKLNFAPTRSFEFWKTFELVLEDKFTRFKPEHIVDIILSCIFLEKYPINFINYIFNPYFLTKLQLSCENWSAVKSNLVLFDHIMTLKCPAYRGPLLPKEFPAVMLSTDKQLKVMRYKVNSALRIEYGSKYKLIDLKILQHCPINHRCVMDIYMKPCTGFEDIPAMAVLIHMPDDYTYDGGNLTGMQELRIRHFMDMGLKVINLNYLHVVSHCGSSSGLAKYLNEVIDSTLNPSK